MNKPNIDWRDVAVQRQRVMRDLGNLPWAPREVGGFRPLGWCLVVTTICAALIGLLAIGSK